MITLTWWQFGLIIFGVICATSIAIVLRDAIQEINR